MNNYGKDYVDSFLSYYADLLESSDRMRIDRYAMRAALADASLFDEPEDTLCSNNYVHE